MFFGKTRVNISKTSSRSDSLVVCFRRLLVRPVLDVATRAKFSSGLIFPAVPMTTGCFRPALHARRARGRGDVQPVLIVARRAQFSSGLIFAVVPLPPGRIRPALHARRTRGRGDVQPVLRVARPVKFISGLIFAVDPLCSNMRPAIHARRPPGGFDGQLLRRIWNSNDVSRDETACDWKLSCLRSRLGKERQRKKEESGTAHLPFVTRLAEPLALLELRQKHCACICPILTATGALATAGSELRKKHYGYWVRM